MIEGEGKEKPSGFNGNYKTPTVSLYIVSVIDDEYDFVVDYFRDEGQIE